MHDVFNRTLTLFIIMMIGLLAAKTNIFTREVRTQLSKFLLFITAPLLIIINFQIDYSKDLLINMGIVAAVAAIVIGAGIFIGWHLWKRTGDEKRPVLIYASAFPNCGYLGYPVIGGLYGQEGVIYVAIFVMVFQIYMWTLGVWLFTGKPSKWYKPLLRPALIAVAIGIVLFTFSLKLPVPLYDAASMVGGMTSPLAMLLVGSFLADSKIKEMLTEKYTYFIAIIRFIFWPTLVFFALKPFNLSEVVYASCVLISAMPAAANTVILATRYDKNPRFASELVALTTLMSLALIPLWMYLITGGV